MFGNLFQKNKRHNKFLYSEKIEINLDNSSSQHNQVLDITNTKQNKLPQNFAQDLLDLEMDVECENVDLVTITKLLQLYAIAIEYYESIKSKRYLIFKNKTQALLLKANVQESMDRAQNKENDEKQLSDSTNKVKTNKQSLQQRQKEIELNMKYIKQQDNQEDVKILLHNHNSSFEHNSNLIKKEINEQENIILKRLEKRKQSVRQKTEDCDKENRSPDRDIRSQVLSARFSNEKVKKLENDCI